MRAVEFENSIGWLHLPAPVVSGQPSGDGHALGKSRAVLLCGSIGREASSLHRPWVLLAEQVAAAGMPALRFDYPGAGNSSLEEEEALSLTAWTDSIMRAAAWLKQRTGVAEVALCAIRFGAILAMHAARSNRGFAATALLQPVISGRLFLREQEALARLSDTLWMVRHPFATNHHWEAFGLRLSRTMHRQLQTIELTDLDCGGLGNTLILSSNDDPQSRLLAERLHALHAEAVVEPFPECVALMRDDLLNSVPARAFDRVTEWLGKDAPEGCRCGLEPSPPAVITWPDFRETAVQFGPRGRLFGIYCAPAVRAPSAAVAIYPTGAMPQYGQSRMGVTFARRLARHGIASLRFDLSGMGDSCPSSGHDRPLFSSAWLEEARAPIEWLQRETSAPVIVFGNCSGAYAAFQVARSHRAVRGAVIVNLQHFNQHALKPLQVQQRTPRTLRHYARRLRSGVIWYRLLTGGVPIANISRSIWRTGRQLLGSPEIDAERKIVRQWFEDLQARRVEMLMVYGNFDGGLDELELHFGPAGRGLKAFRNTRIAIVRGADHAFSHHPSREQLFESLLEMARNRVSAPAITELAA